MKSHRTVARLVSIAALTVFCWWVQIGAAVGSPLRADAPDGPRGPLSWIDLTDSHGVSIWNEELSIDRGGITSITKLVWSIPTDVVWTLYRSIVALALWFLDWVLSLGWLDTVSAPMLATGAAMHSAVARLGVLPTVLLTITALFAAVWIMRGSWATGVFEILAALVVAALATGIFAQPVALLAGQNGLIAQTDRAGLELASALSDPHSDVSDVSSEELRERQTEQLVDTFIREPLQLINFGALLDGTKCEKVYTKVLKGGPYGEDSDIRDAVATCDEAAGDYAANPSPGMAMAAAVISPASGILVVLVVVMGGSVVLAGCFALFAALKVIVHLVTGLLPGGARGPLFMAIAEAAVSLLIVLATTVFLGVFVIVILAVFTNSDDNPAKTFVIVDILLVVGLVIFWRMRKAMKESAARLAAMMSKRPGAAPAKVPTQGRGVAPAAASAGRTAARVAQMRATRRIANRPAGGTTNNNVLIVPGAGGAKPPRQTVASEFEQPDNTSNPPQRRGVGGTSRKQLGSAPSPTGTPSRGPRKMVSTAAATAAKLAVTASTGVPVGALSRGAKAAYAAKNLRARIDERKSPAAKPIAGRPALALPAAAAPRPETSGAEKTNPPTRRPASLPKPSPKPTPPSPKPVPPTRKVPRDGERPRRYERVVRNGQVLHIPASADSRTGRR